VSWTKQEDESVMSNLQKAHERLNQEGRLTPWPPQHHAYRVHSRRNFRASQLSPLLRLTVVARELI
jgi:hypothetical protein